MASDRMTVVAVLRARDEMDRGLRSARGRLDAFQRHVRYAGIAAVAAVGAAATRGIGQVIRVTEQTESLRATLHAVTGSANQAAVAFANMEQFASQLPFQVEELVQAFIKLKAFGLDSSREAIESYANIASTFSVRLGDVIEGVADAITSEFERMKQFGIRARDEGDTIKFIFRGVTTEVRDNTEEIERYLLRLANTEFAGAATLQMETLRGAFSNLADGASEAARRIGEAGLSDGLKTLAGTLEETARQAHALPALLGLAANLLSNLASLGVRAAAALAPLAVGALVVGIGRLAAGLTGAGQGASLFARTGVGAIRRMNLLRKAAEGLSKALRFVGGPWGLAIAGAVALTDHILRAREVAKSLADEGKRYLGYQKESVEVAAAAQQAKIRELRAEREAVTARLKDLETTGAQAAAAATRKRDRRLLRKGIDREDLPSPLTLLSLPGNTTEEILAAIGKEFKKRNDLDKQLAALEGTGGEDGGGGGAADSTDQSSRIQRQADAISELSRAADRLLPQGERRLAEIERRYADLAQTILHAGFSESDAAEKLARVAQLRDQEVEQFLSGRAKKAVDEYRARRERDLEEKKQAARRYADLLRQGTDERQTEYERDVAAVREWERETTEAAREVARHYGLSSGGLTQEVAKRAAERLQVLSEELDERKRLAAEEAAIEARRRALAESDSPHLGIREGLRRLTEDTRSAAEEWADVTEGAAQRMSASLTEFVRSGKLNFGSLVDYIIQESIRLSVVDPLIKGLAGALGNLFGGSAFNAPVGASGLPTGPSGYPRLPFHTGGIVGEGPHRWPRFHGGGLASDEVPAILRKREGVFTPEQMAALAPAGPQQVEIRLVNQGAPKRAEVASQQTDGRTLVLGVLMQDLVERGDYSTALERTMGLRRVTT